MHNPIGTGYSGAHTCKRPRSRLAGRPEPSRATPPERPSPSSSSAAPRAHLVCRVGAAPEPADRCLVVVRPGVAEAVLIVHVRQVHVEGAAAPRKLQHHHAGRADRLPAVGARRWRSGARVCMVCCSCTGSNPAVKPAMHCRRDQRAAQPGKVPTNPLSASGAASART